MNRGKEPKSYYIENYLQEKYEGYCRQILFDSKFPVPSPNRDFYNINFSTFFDKMVFVILYENDKFEEVLKEAYRLIYSKLNDLEPFELNFLFTKCIITKNLKMK